MSITYNKLISGYEGDITKECGLTVNEVDNNFFFLRGSDIETVTVNEDKTQLSFRFVNGSVIEVPISQDFSELNDRVNDIIDDVIVLDGEKNFIKEHIENLYKELGFDENGKFMSSHPTKDGEQQECTIYIRDCETVNGALFELDNAIAEVEGMYSEDIIKINEKVDNIEHIVDSNINDIINNNAVIMKEVSDLNEYVKQELVILKNKDNILQKHINDEITLRDSNDIRIENEYKNADKAVENKVLEEQTLRIANDERIENDYKNADLILNNKINSEVSERKVEMQILGTKINNLVDDITKTNGNITRLEEIDEEFRNNFETIDNKFLTIDVINENQEQQIIETDNSVKNLLNRLNALDEIIKGYQSAIQELSARCNNLETENRELRNKIENDKNTLSTQISEITRDGGLLDQCRENAVLESKAQIISSDVFKAEGEEMIVNVENGVVKIGFAETLFLGV